MLLSQTETDELKKLIDSSLNKIYENDKELIDNAVNERAVVFRFGLYLHSLLLDSSFKNYNLDCEYNRNLGDSKRTENWPKGAIPDVLIHKRNSNDWNALVIEFKGYWNPEDREADHKKIIDFTAQNSRDAYKYGLGAVVELGRTKGYLDYYQDYEPN